jgi:hypothetical protein
MAHADHANRIQMVAAVSEARNASMKPTNVSGRKTAMKTGELNNMIGRVYRSS